MSEDLRWTRDRLANFGRWSKTHRVAATCYSAEGRYKPERLTEGEEADRRRSRDGVDVLDALLVWRAVMPARGMPISLSFVLHGYYAWGYRGEPLRAFLRRHGMSVRGRDLADLTFQAENAAHNRLRAVDASHNGFLAFDAPKRAAVQLTNSTADPAE